MQKLPCHLVCYLVVGCSGDFVKGLMGFVFVDFGALDPNLAV